MVIALATFLIRGPTVDRLWIDSGSTRGVCLRVEGPFRGGSEGSIFGLSYGPGTMKFVISDPEIPYIQMEKVCYDFFFVESFDFF